MRPPSSLKKEILKKWMTGLKMWSSSSKEMTLLERKKAIKLSADIAMASARNGATFWSRALIANASKDMMMSTTAKLFMIQPAAATTKNQSRELTTERSTKLSPLPTLQGSRTTSITSGKRILRKARISKNKTRRSRRYAASLIAKKLVKKRTQVLKGLVPGGKYMDESHLIRETLDYIISLQAQVHVMQHLANATQLLLHIKGQSFN